MAALFTVLGVALAALAVAALEAHALPVAIGAGAIGAWLLTLGFGSWSRRRRG